MHKEKKERKEKKEERKRKKKASTKISRCFFERDERLGPADGPDSSGPRHEDLAGSGRPASHVAHHLAGPRLCFLIRPRAAYACCNNFCSASMRRTTTPSSERARELAGCVASGGGGHEQEWTLSQSIHLPESCTWPSCSFVLGRFALSASHRPSHRPSHTPCRLPLKQGNPEHSLARPPKNAQFVAPCERTSHCNRLCIADALRLNQLGLSGYCV